MPAFGFLVEFEAQPGKEQDVADFLVEAKAMVDAEPGTLAWFSFRRGERSFAIFDAFATAEDRETHLHGEVRRALETRGPGMLAVAPTITPVDLLASKLP